MEDHERRRADALFESVFGYFFKASKTRSRTYPIMETLTGLALAAVLFWGGQQVLNGETTVGKFMTFFAALVIAYQPLRSLANLNASLQEGLAAAERIFSKIGRAHVGTPVTNAHLVCRLLLEKKNTH